jgi:hypothetical protein
LIHQGTLVGVLNLDHALVVAADRRVTTDRGITVSEADSKIQPIGPGAVSFTTGLVAIFGGPESKTIFDVPSLVAKAVDGADPTDLRAILPVVGRSLGEAFEGYLRSRNRHHWPKPGEPLLTVGFAWFDRAENPSVVALRLSSESSTSINVSVNAMLWGTQELAKLVPLFFGRTAFADAMAHRNEPEWQGFRKDPIVAKILDESTKPRDVSAAEAESYLRNVIRLSSEEGPRRLGQPETVGPDSLCYLLKPKLDAIPLQ